MRKTAVLFALLFCIFTVFGCSKGLKRPDTNLEFWICENVEGFDFSSYTEKYGLMGGREYYGSGYIPETDENGEQIDPDHCVIYTVTSYPDYSSNESHVTRISITDPAVEIYGLTLNSSVGEIGAVMEENGFKAKIGSGASGLSFEKNGVTVRFGDECIIISTEVSNIFGIVF